MLTVARMPKEEQCKMTTAINRIASKISWADFYFLCEFHPHVDFYVFKHLILTLSYNKMYKDNKNIV